MKKLCAFSASRFFACLRGKPNTLRCCFPLFPRRVARERGSPFPRKSTPFRLRCASCGTVVPLKVTLGKSAILPRFIGLYSMCPQHRNVCDAPLCGCMSKHFTRSFVAQRFKSAFHVFALAKTFHFCAEVPWQKHFTFARKICSLIARSYPRKNFTIYTYLCRTGAIKGAWESDAFACRFGRREVQLVVVEKWCGEVT